MKSFFAAHIFIKLAIMAFFAMGWAAVVSATVMMYLPPDKLTQEASLIVRGTVTKTQSRADKNNPALIVTHITIQPSEIYKGQALVPKNKPIVVTVPGGHTPELSLRIPGSAAFRPKEEVVVFIEGTGPGHFTVLGMTQGKYNIIRRADGSIIATRSLKGFQPVSDHPSASFAVPPHQEITLSELEKIIRDNQ